MEVALKVCAVVYLEVCLHTCAIDNRLEKYLLSGCVDGLPRTAAISLQTALNQTCHKFPDLTRHLVLKETKMYYEQPPRRVIFHICDKDLRRIPALHTN